MSELTRLEPFHKSLETAIKQELTKFAEEKKNQFLKEYEDILRLEFNKVVARQVIDLTAHMRFEDFHDRLSITIIKGKPE